MPVPDELRILHDGGAVGRRGSLVPSGGSTSSARVENRGGVVGMEGPDLAGCWVVAGPSRDGGGRDAEHDFQLPEAPSQVDEGLGWQGPEGGRIARTGPPAGLLGSDNKAGMIRDGMLKGLHNVRVLGPGCWDSDPIDGGRAGVFPPGWSSGHQDSPMLGEEGLEPSNGAGLLVAPRRDKVEIEVAREVGRASKRRKPLSKLSDDAALGSLRKIDRDDPDRRLSRGGAEGLHSATSDELASLGLKVVRHEDGRPSPN